MSEEVAIVAILRPAPGKLERLRELVTEAITWIEENEPETLEFSLYEEDGEDGVKLALFERYASQAAMKKHESSEKVGEFFKIVTEEELLAGPPVSSKGRYCHSFRR